MLLARVAFDLLRSPKFKLQVIAHIQKKLDELKVPDYINALQVILVMPCRFAHTLVDALLLEKANGFVLKHSWVSLFKRTAGFRFHCSKNLSYMMLCLLGKIS